MAVRRRLGSGPVWCTTFPAKPSASGANDRIDKFVGAKDPPPSCPALP